MADVEAIVQPPRLVEEATDSNRRSSPLESFYDLIFAIAITALSDLLSRDQSWANLARFVALFLPIWWAWVGLSVYSSRFENDDFVHRILMFTSMLGAIFMSVRLSFVWQNAGSHIFAVGYLMCRGTLLVLYARAHFAVKDARDLTSMYLRGFSLGAAFWVASLWLDPPLETICWAAGLLIDFSVPWFGRRALDEHPLDVSHLPDRMGAFTMTVLGISILGVVRGIARFHFQPDTVVAAILAFVLAATIWWSYYGLVQRAPIDNTLGSGQPFVYIHLPLVIGLTLLGVGLQNAIGEADQDSLSDRTAAILFTGVLAWNLAFLALAYISHGKNLERTITHAGLLHIGVLLLMAVFCDSLRPVAVLVLLVTTTMSYLLYRHRLHRATDAAKP